MKKENPMAKQRNDPDPDDLGNQPAVPMSPDEMLELEQSVIRAEDDENDEELADASDELKEPNSEDR